MQLGMIGLGRMGSNMVRRLMAGGHECVVYDRSTTAIDALAGEGATGAHSLEALVASLAAPRAIWVMVPAGGPTEETVAALGTHLSPGDIVIDGGNSYFKDDVRRAAALAQQGIQYVDAGTSGGVFGRERGYCLMVGGDRVAVDRLRPILVTLAPGVGTTELTPGRDGTSTADQGYLHCGPVGAGHFVKMIHNGIEYGLMQAYAEGFNILKHAGGAELPEGQRYDLPLADIAELWRRGSVVGSWLLDLTAMALVEQPDLHGYSGVVEDSGEGRWAVQAAIEEAVPADVLAASLFSRFRSRQTPTFGDKVLSAMRFKFGGASHRHDRALPTGT